MATAHRRRDPQTGRFLSTKKHKYHSHPVKGMGDAEPHPSAETKATHILEDFALVTIGAIGAKFISQKFMVNSPNLANFVSFGLGAVIHWFAEEIPIGKAVGTGLMVGAGLNLFQQTLGTKMGLSGDLPQGAVPAPTFYVEPSYVEEQLSVQAQPPAQQQPVQQAAQPMLDWNLMLQQQPVKQPMNALQMLRDKAQDKQGMKFMARV